MLKAGPSTVDIRDDQGVRRRFTQDQLDKRGIQIIKDGKVIRVGQLREGDTFTATLVTKAEPVVLTEKDVQATTAPGKAEPMTASKAAKAEPKAAEPKAAEPKAESAPTQVAKADAPRPPPHPQAPPLSQPPSRPHRRRPNRLAWGRCGTC